MEHVLALDPIHRRRRRACSRRTAQAHGGPDRDAPLPAPASTDITIWEGVRSLALTCLALFAIHRATVALGTVEGEIDRGEWYEFEARDGGIRYERTYDSTDTVFIRPEAMDALVRGDFRGTRLGYGASAVRRTWLLASGVDTTGWQLFDSEAEALAFLRGAGVEPGAVRYRYQ